MKSKSKRGATVWASEDIHCNGEVIIKRLTRGKIESSGSYALNVKFDGYPHIILCLWNMVSITTERKQLELWNRIT